MRKYKGYYIDGTTFKNEAEIDCFLKEQAIESLKTAVKVFNINCTMEACDNVHKVSENLVNNFGLSWEEIEEIELSVA